MSDVTSLKQEVMEERFFPPMLASRRVFTPFESLSHDGV